MPYVRLDAAAADGGLLVFASCRASVVLLGTDVADKLFGRTESLVGETVRIEGRPFRVIGVLESKGGSAFSNEDDRVIVPLTTAQTRLYKSIQQAKTAITRMCAW